MEKNTLIITALEALRQRNNEHIDASLENLDYFQKQNEAIATLIKEILEKKGTPVGVPLPVRQ